MAKEIVAMILAGGRGSRLDVYKRQAVGVLSLVRLAGLFRLLSRFIVNGDVIGLGAGAERRGLLFALGLIAVSYTHLELW